VYPNEAVEAGQNSPCLHTGACGREPIKTYGCDAAR
jgi:hypothetical protein